NPLQYFFPGPIQTPISGGAISTYFRFAFVYPELPIGAQFFARYTFADGLVAYFNGAEVYRQNLPDSKITPYTPALSDILPVETAVVPVQGALNGGGLNLIAAELHAHSGVDQSLAFGLELSARILSWARGSVVITSGPDDV